MIAVGREVAVEEGNVQEMFHRSLKDYNISFRALII